MSTSKPCGSVPVTGTWPFGARKTACFLGVFATLNCGSPIQGHHQTLYILSNWTSKGSAWDWVEAIDDAAQELGLTLGSFLPYTGEEKERLTLLPK